jgi:predicted acetyltransferase
MTAPNPILRLPHQDEEAEFLRAHRATTPDVPSFLHYYRDGMTLREYLIVLAELEQGVNLQSPHQVPETFLFAFLGDRIVGRVAIRHCLNESLEREGGHLGYVVVPEYRRQGHATTMLRLALAIAREKTGASKILVTCDDGNVGSARTIEKNGGVLENVVVVPERGKAIRRYWIQLS